MQLHILIIMNAYEYNFIIFYTIIVRNNYIININFYTF